MSLVHRVAALVVCLGIAAAIPLRAGQPPTLIVNVVDYAHAASGLLVEAEHHVARVYGAAGVTVLWRENLPPSVPANPAQVNVCILSEAMVALKTQKEKIPSTVLGTAAPPPVKRAWIFLSRIEDVAAGHNMSAGLILGHVIAHEVAHMVAHVPHSEDGLMAALMHIRYDTLQGFTNAQSQQIRAAIDANSRAAMLQARSQPHFAP